MVVRKSTTTVKKAGPAKKAAATKKAAKRTDSVIEDTDAEAEAAEKAAAKATKKAEAAARKEAKSAQYSEQQAEVVRLRDDEGLSLKAISEQMGLNPVTTQVMYIRAKQPKVNKRPTPDTIFKMRDDDKMAWARIGASFDPVLTKAQVQALYKQGGHDPHMSFVGKGGRYGKYEEHRPAKPVGEKKAKRASKSTGPVFSDPDGVTIEEVKAVIDGKTINFNANGATATAKVATELKVGKNKQGVRLARFKDDNGNLRSVPIADITRVR
ncbi:MAG TPA: sigma-70 region 4 domain-containing protein [Ktedonobacteraceae bacterium]